MPSGACGGLESLRLRSETRRVPPRSRIVVASVNGRRPGQRLFQRRDADLGLIGEELPGDAPARQLLPDHGGDRPALLVGELLID
jgi:hypothetical protein